MHFHRLMSYQSSTAGRLSSVGTLAALCFVTNCLFVPEAAGQSASASLAAERRSDTTASVHRLESTQRSVFDAFVYVNRIPIVAEEGETADDLAGRILGRLANQEGRVLIKLPPGMTRQAYRGFKVGLEAGDGPHAGRCFSCHQLPDLSSSTLAKPIPSLRNLAEPQHKNFGLAIRSEAHAGIVIDAKDVADINAFLKTLTDVSDSEFRQLIIDARVVDMLGDTE